MKTTIHKSNTRGHANHGWLDTHHTFSFGHYFAPDRMHFGTLRVLNDDRVAGGGGFPTHPHKNMEIISIPLSGDLEHQDSMGNKVVIKEGDVQVMSAGTGIQHSEYNKNSDQEVQFLQIWVYPRERNVTPRYDQITLADIHKDNSFYQILSPNKDDEGVWINQDAWFHLGEFSEESQGDYQLRDSENGVYAFVIEGTITIGDETLEKRDGLAIEETKSFMYEATPGTKVLLMEVPMNKKVII